MVDVTVAIPVGPRPSHQRWLPEALASVRAQYDPPQEVLLIDDMAALNIDPLADILFGEGRWQKTGFPAGGAVAFAEVSPGVRHFLRTWRSPWRLGVPAAFNMGVALARHDLVLMLGSDDTLDERALTALGAVYDDQEHRDGFYWFGVRYMDTGELQALPCNCAAVTKGLWRLTGGFAPEMAVGACDSMLISILLANRPDLLIPVAGGAPLFNYRRHDDTDTAGRGAYQRAIFDVRDHLTSHFEPAAWGRFE